ncbi:hypothetical protein [Salibacterium lacus]|uniref:Transposase domain-containing protein n=1 Tax=Salibacterium lacus TaxID=1898109 RepID=A0ABW5T4N6_9BACI
MNPFEYLSYLFEAHPQQQKDASLDDFLPCKNSVVKFS